jgi:hypothetical protein
MVVVVSGVEVAIGSLVESDASYFSFRRSAWATQDLDALRRDLTSKIRDAERLHGIIFLRFSWE